MQDILTNDETELKPVYMLYGFGGAFRWLRYFCCLNMVWKNRNRKDQSHCCCSNSENWLNWLGTCCCAASGRFTSHCCQPARGHMVMVLKSFSAPPLEGYSPCHLPLVIIKENTIIVSSLGTLSAQHCSVGLCLSHMLSTRLLAIWWKCGNSAKTNILKISRCW